MSSETLPWRATVLTLFPEMFPGPLGISLAGRALASGLWALEARDIRFPTSRWLDGSDAMHTDPDYSAAYVVLRTDADDGIEGHGLTFTSGRGTEVCVAAARALEPLVVGRTLEGIVADAC